MAKVISETNTTISWDSEVDPKVSFALDQSYEDLSFYESETGIPLKTVKVSVLAEALAVAKAEL